MPFSIDAYSQQPTKQNLRHGNAKQKLDPSSPLTRRHRDAGRRRWIWQDHIAQGPQIKEGIRGKHVEKGEPVEPAADMEAAHGQDHEGADKFVARVREQVENGVVTLDVEEVASEFDDTEFNEHDGECS